MYNKLYPIYIFLALVIGGCKNITEPGQDKDSVQVNKPVDNHLNSGRNSISDRPDSILVSSKNRQLLVLTSGALQLVDQQSGSSKELSFGIPSKQMIETISKVLGMKPANLGINQECGAGPLQMASWSNGLTLVSQKKRGSSDWEFSGWYMGVSPGSSSKLTTMAGIGIGSSRSETESAYVIDVSKTTLGYEFSTTSGLYGIFDGSGKDAKISSLWSGLSCNFR
ncbi:hypothetical protein [Daejeonella oryzae]|uniref:hypothetical protein n=1 Tax=Daejeonella oryzae TaxID=1122943 RepID=UPI0004287CA9|nr:hypothetical protein [Daejeonella oryzae]